VPAQRAFDVFTASFCSDRGRVLAWDPPHRLVVTGQINGRQGGRNPVAGPARGTLPARGRAGRVFRAHESPAGRWRRARLTGDWAQGQWPRPAIGVW